MPPNPQYAASSTLYDAYPTPTASSGSVYLYTDTSCQDAIFSNAEDLSPNVCRDMPVQIGSVKISTLPTCPEDGNPYILISNLPSCQPSTNGTKQDGDQIGECKAFSSGVDIESMQFMCWANGNSAATTENGYGAPSTNGYAAATSYLGEIGGGAASSTQQQSMYTYSYPTDSTGSGGSGSSGTTYTYGDDGDGDGEDNSSGHSSCCSCSCSCCCVVM
jgi:hypothetical protein